MKMNGKIIAGSLAGALFALAGCMKCDCGPKPYRIDVAAGSDLNEVVERVRALAPSNKANGVEIVLASGDYNLAKPVVFDKRDGGVSNTVPVVWRSAEAGKARILCATRIPSSAFSPVKDPSLLQRLPSSARGKVYEADLSGVIPGKIKKMADAFGGRPTGPYVFVNHDFGTLARWPNGEYSEFTKCVDKGTVERHRPDGGKICEPGAFVYSDPRAKRWDFSKGVWMRGFWTHDWDSHAVRAAGYGIENGTNDVIRLASRIPYGVMSGTWGRKGRRLYFFNIFDEIDMPGEWFIDREKKRLYIYPPSGAVSATDEIFVSSDFPHIVKGENVKHMKFEGLVFEYAFNDGVRFVHSSDITFSNCVFSTIGAAGLTANGSNITVADCEVKNTSGAGMSISGGDRQKLVRANSLVTRNKIHNFGVFQRTYAPGIGLGGCGSTCSHNEIFNAPHSAVLYSGNEHLFEYNDVHHVLLETGDAGAFYTGRDWTTQGNVLRYNFVHELGADGDHANTMGFYFDDCDCGDEVTGNVFWKVARGIMIGGGREHPVRNNVFAECIIGLSIDGRGITWRHWNSMKHGGPSWMLEEKAKRLKYTEDPWKSKYPRLANIMNDSPREPLYNPVEENVFINCSKSLLWLAGKELDNVIPKCSFKDNLVFVLPPMEKGATPDKRIEKAYKFFDKGTDTGFVDPLNGDFRMKEGGTVLRELLKFYLGERFGRVKQAK
jgi:hypothetical protein